MKFALVALSIFGLTTLTTSAFSVDLEMATNDQILAELSHRLTGGVSGGLASVAYSCSSDNNLIITVVGGSTTSTQSISTYDPTTCRNQITNLAQHRSRIRSAGLIAVCSYDTNLYQFSIKGEGSSSLVSSTFTGNLDACLAQANSANGN